jgi:hypothetical protein
MNSKRIPDALNTAVAWLQAHWIINIALVIGYALFILLAHKAFVQHSIWVMNALTLPVYNGVVAGIAGCFGVLFVLLMLSYLRINNPERPRKLFYLIAILLLLVVHHNFLFEMNIEVIHAMQFAVLGFLLFPFTQRFGAAIAMGIPIMMLDEWYQYRVLYPDYVQYFDFNDILMDILGCALLFCGMWIVGVRTKPVPQPIYRRPEIILMSALSVAILGAMFTCTIAFFPENECLNTWLVLNKLPNPIIFWQAHPFTGRIYHAIPPMEGMAVILGISLFFLGMGDQKEKHQI